MSSDSSALLLTAEEFVLGPALPKELDDLFEIDDATPDNPGVDREGVTTPPKLFLESGSYLRSSSKFNGVSPEGADPLGSTNYCLWRRRACLHRFLIQASLKGAPGWNHLLPKAIPDSGQPEYPDSGDHFDRGIKLPVDEPLLWLTGNRGHGFLCHSG